MGSSIGSPLSSNKLAYYPQDYFARPDVNGRFAMEFPLPAGMYIQVEVETPVKLTEHQRKLLKDLDDSLRKGGDRHSPSEKSWAERVKDLFK